MSAAPLAIGTTPWDFGNGEVIDGRWDVTPAVFIHTELHRSRPDARVIIHNHPYYGSLLSTMHVQPDIIDQQACMFDGDIALFDEYTGGVDDADGGQYLAGQRAVDHPRGGADIIDCHGGRTRDHGCSFGDMVQPVECFINS